MLKFFKNSSRPFSFTQNIQNPPPPAPSTFPPRAPADIDFNVGDDEPMQIDSSSKADIPPFTREEVMEAMKSSNFNKGLGPDCFDGNLLKDNQPLNDKVTTEITIALNNANIPQYLRVGRLVPL